MNLIVHKLYLNSEKKKNSLVVRAEDLSVRVQCGKQKPFKIF